MSLKLLIHQKLLSLYTICTASIKNAKDRIEEGMKSRLCFKCISFLIYLALQTEVIRLNSSSSCVTFLHGFCHYDPVK